MALNKKKKKIQAIKKAASTIRTGPSESIQQSAPPVNMASDVVPTPPHSEPPFDPFHTSLKIYFQAAKFSDLVIKTADEEIKVHKLVVCGQSAVFSRIFDGDWKETDESAIDLKNDDPKAVEAMISFMYKFEYDDTDSNSPVLLNAKVYELAERYSIIALKAYAATKFESAVSNYWNSDGFAQSIGEIYAGAPAAARDLGQHLVNVSRENISNLLQNEDFKYTLETVTGFAALLVERLASEAHVSYRCPQCSRIWSTRRIEATEAFYCPSCAYRTSWTRYIVT